MRPSISVFLTIAAMLLTTDCMGPGPQYKTGITVKEIMDSVVDPNADYLWESVSYEENLKGIIDKSPKTDEDWRDVRRHAVALMEAMNVLQIPGRPVAHPGEKAADPRVEEPPEVITTMIASDRASWNKNANGLYDATSLVLKAVDAKNVDALSEAGDRIDKACESCHLKYWYPEQYGLNQTNRPSASERKTP